MSNMITLNLAFTVSAAVVSVVVATGKHLGQYWRHTTGAGAALVRIITGATLATGVLAATDIVLAGTGNSPLQSSLLGVQLGLLMLVLVLGAVDSFQVAHSELILRADLDCYRQQMEELKRDAEVRRAQYEQDERERWQRLQEHLLGQREAGASGAPSVPRAPWEQDALNRGYRWPTASSWT